MRSCSSDDDLAEMDEVFFPVTDLVKDVRRRSMWNLLVLALIVLGGRAVAQDSVVLRGSWTATTAAGAVFRGSWSAQQHPDAPNAAYGSWTLVNDDDQFVLEGTWSADKVAESWRGSWSAQTLAGRSLSGTWEATLDGGEGKTFMDMLQRSVSEELSGTWRAGGLGGRWRVRAFSP